MRKTIRQVVTSKLKNRKRTAKSVKKVYSTFLKTVLVRADVIQLCDVLGVKHTANESMETMLQNIEKQRPDLMRSKTINMLSAIGGMHHLDFVTMRKYIGIRNLSVWIIHIIIGVYVERLWQKVVKNPKNDSWLFNHQIYSWDQFHNIDDPGPLPTPELESLHAASKFLKLWTRVIGIHQILELVNFFNGSYFDTKMRQLYKKKSGTFGTGTALYALERREARKLIKAIKERTKQSRTSDIPTLG